MTAQLLATGPYGGVDPSAMGGMPLLLAAATPLFPQQARVVSAEQQGADVSRAAAREAKEVRQREKEVLAVISRMVGQVEAAARKEAARADKEERRRAAAGGKRARLSGAGAAGAPERAPLGPVQADGGGGAGGRKARLEREMRTLRRLDAVPISDIESGPDGGAHGDDGGCVAVALRLRAVQTCDAQFFGGEVPKAQTKRVGAQAAAAARRGARGGAGGNAEGRGGWRQRDGWCRTAFGAARLCPHSLGS